MFVAPSGSSLKDHYNRTDGEIHEKIDAMFELIRGKMTDVIDVVIIDNSPSQTGVALECTMRADRILIPSRPDDVCFDALIRTYSFLNNQVQGILEKSITIVPSIVENRKMHKDFLLAMRKKYEGLNNNTKVSMAITNRSEVPSTMMEKKVLYISHAASETAQQHKQVCLDIFPWLEKETFYKDIENIVIQKKVAIQEKFKEMVKVRMLVKAIEMKNTGGDESITAVQQN